MFKFCTIFIKLLEVIMNDNYSKGLFDEKSNIWIKIYKVYVCVMFCLLCLTTLILSFVGISGDFLLTDESPFLNFISILLSGALLTFLHLVTNMIILNFLNNIQIIRESVEKPIDNNFVSNTQQQTYTHTPQYETMWTCPTCYTSNSTANNFCEKCGNKNPSSNLGARQRSTIPSINEWKCPRCGIIQQNYVGTCGCGERKPN